MLLTVTSASLCAQVLEMLSTVHATLDAEVTQGQWLRWVTPALVAPAAPQPHHPSAFQNAVLRAHTAPSKPLPAAQGDVEGEGLYLVPEGAGARLADVLPTMCSLPPETAPMGVEDPLAHGLVAEMLLEVCVANAAQELCARCVPLFPTILICLSTVSEHAALVQPSHARSSALMPYSECHNHGLRCRSKRRSSRLASWRRCSTRSSCPQSEAHAT